MDHIEPRTRRAALVMTHWVLSGIRRAERAVASKAHRLDQSSQHPIGLAISTIDDPTAEMRLLGLRGHLSLDTMPILARALQDVSDGTSLHIDVTDLAIGGAAVIDQTELLIDQLEARRVRLRIVGLDPRHPALSGPRF